MKKFLLFGLLFISSFISAQNTLEIEVTNIKNDKGVIGIGLYNNPDTFTDPDAEFRAIKVKAEKGKVVVVLEDLPSGIYAAAILHDENNNDKMDFNFIGAPKEAYGFSNNARGFMAAPKFSKAAFEVKQGDSTSISIKLRK